MALPTMTSEREAITRQPIWLVKITLDQCTRTRGVLPCTAAVNCRYTYTTCKDNLGLLTWRTNYSKSSYDRNFCSRGATVSGAMPLLESPPTFVETRIDQKNFKSERGEVTLKFAADVPLPLSNPNKTVSATDTGSYWPNLLAQNPNYHGRLIEIYRGYAGVDPTTFTLYFRGVIEKMTCEPGGATIKAKDMLWKLAENKFPAKPNEAVLKVAYSGGDTIYIDGSLGGDVDEFEYALTGSHAGCLKIDDEYITYAWRDSANNRFQGCVPAQYETIGATHAIGAKVTQAVIYSDANYAAGLPPDYILMDLLTRYGTINASYIDTVDSGTTLAVAYVAYDNHIHLASSAGFPASGCVKLGNEWLYYNGISGNDLINVKHSQFMTTAANHALGLTVYLSRFTTELQFWIQGALYKARFENQIAVKDAVNKLTEATLCDIWQNEAGFITCKHQSPPLPGVGVTPKDLTKRTIVYKTRNLDAREDLRITRAYLFYNALKVDAGTSETDYTSQLIWAGAAEEGANFYNEVASKSFYNPWIYRSNEATFFAQRYFTRYRMGSPMLKFRLELKEDDSLVGDYLYITVPERVDETGAMIQKTYQITRKKQKGLNELEIEAVDTGFGTMNYGLISALAGDYAGRVPPYCWIGNAINHVGVLSEDGYYIL